jgi:hypothetical protein
MEDHVKFSNENLENVRGGPRSMVDYVKFSNENLENVRGGPRSVVDPGP